MFFGEPSSLSSATGPKRSFVPNHSATYRQCTSAVGASHSALIGLARVRASGDRDEGSPQPLVVGVLLAALRGPGRMLRCPTGPCSRCPGRKPQLSRSRRSTTYQRPPERRQPGPTPGNSTASSIRTSAQVSQASAPSSPALQLGWCQGWEVRGALPVHARRVVGASPGVQWCVGHSGPLGCAGAGLPVVRLTWPFVLLSGCAPTRPSGPLSGQ
jgi:hypothetical protein